MRHPPLLIQRRHRRGPCALAQLRMHQPHRHIRPGAFQHLPHHFAALIGLGDDLPRANLAAHRNRSPRPVERPQARR